MASSESEFFEMNVIRYYTIRYITITLFSVIINQKNYILYKTKNIIFSSINFPIQ